MNAWAAHQCANNVQSKDYRSEFGPHRAQVTSLLLRPSASRARLCILGAGNCNDLELDTLLRAYREIHLVDLDAQALAHGLAQQGFEGEARIHCYGDTDVSGLLEEMTRWGASSIPDEELVACIEAPVRQMRALLPGPFEVVASTCLLSQLMHAVVRHAGEGHPRFLPLLQALRTGHLRLLAGLAAGGGTGVLVSDIVSSDSAPHLGSVPPDALPAALAQLVQARNFFHGLNPAVITSIFRSDPVIAPAMAELQTAAPWLWSFGPRTYAVCAWTFRKCASDFKGAARR
jgi:hypothetical protein